MADNECDKIKSNFNENKNTLLTSLGMKQNSDNGKFEQINDIYEKPFNELTSIINARKEFINDTKNCDFKNTVDTTNATNSSKSNDNNSNLSNNNNKTDQRSNLQTLIHEFVPFNKQVNDSVGKFKKSVTNTANAVKTGAIKVGTRAIKVGTRATTAVKTGANTLKNLRLTKKGGTCGRNQSQSKKKKYKQKKGGRKTKRNNM